MIKTQNGGVQSKHLISSSTVADRERTGEEVHKAFNSVNY